MRRKVMNWRIFLKRRVKTDLKTLKLNFQPPSAALFREMYSASHGMQIYRKRRHCSLLLKEVTSDA